MKIAQFDRSNLKVVHEKLQSALDAAAKELGLDAKIGTIRFDSNRFTASLEVVPNSPEAKAGAQSQEDQMLELYGLKRGQKIKLSGSAHTIVGYKAKAKKNSIIVESINGTRYVTDPYTAKFCLIS